MTTNVSTSKRITFIGLGLIAVFSFFYCFDYLLQISISIFLPAIKRNFALNDFKLGLVGSVFFISYVMMQIPAGYFIDRFGPWLIAIWMSLICSLGALCMYFSISSYYLLLFSRLLIGFGSSISFLCAIKIISQYAPVRAFAFFIGALQALAGLGAIVGQSPIAYLNHYYRWNQIGLIFFIIAFFFLVYFIVGRKKVVDQSFQQRSADKTAHSLKTVLAVVTDSTVIKISILSFIAWSPVASLAGFWLIQYLHSSNHMSTLTSSSVIILFWIGVMLGSILIPLLSEWYKTRRQILILGFVIQFVATLIIIIFSKNFILLTLALFLIGAVSPIQGFCMVLVKDIQTTENFGITCGMVNMCGAVSGGVLQFVVGFALTYCFTRMSNPYLWAFGIYPVLSLLGLSLCIFKLNESYPEVISNN